jgi:hypothetical protein
VLPGIGVGMRSNTPHSWKSRTAETRLPVLNQLMITSGGERREATSSMAAALAFICASFVSGPMAEVSCSMVLPIFATSDRSRSTSTGWGPGAPGGLPFMVAFPFGVEPGPGPFPPLNIPESTLLSLEAMLNEM